MRRLLLVLAALILPACQKAAVTSPESIPMPIAPPTSAHATFGAGCFWGVEAFFRAQPGVLDAVSGYMGGRSERPTYEDICGGDTGHIEVVQVTYDPTRIGYRALLTAFFEHHDPTTRDRQGPDIGEQYRSVIFAHDPEQARLARAAVDALNAARLFPRPVVTDVQPAAAFWRAEEYHQRYLERHPHHGSCHWRRPVAVAAVIAALP